MDKRIKGLIVACCSLGVAMLMSAPAWSVAAQEAAPAASVTLEELDQIVLHGKRMEQRMLESEQRFYRLYNTLNTRQDFHVNCRYMARASNSSGFGASSFRQSCVPVFYSDAVAEEGGLMAGSGSCGFSSFFSTGTFAPAHSGPDGSFVIPVGMPRSSTYANLPTCDAQPIQVSARPQLMWLDRRDAFAENLSKVMRSDPQLLALGGQFQSLIEESTDAQKQATDARKLRVELRLAARKCPVPTSPRNATKACKSG